MLIEGTIEQNMLSGYTDNYVRVQIPYHPTLENTIAMVRIGAYDGDRSTGEIVSIRSAQRAIMPVMPVLPVINS